MCLSAVICLSLVVFFAIPFSLAPLLSFPLKGDEEEEERKRARDDVTGRTVRHLICVDSPAAGAARACECQEEREGERRKEARGEEEEKTRHPSSDNHERSFQGREAGRGRSAGGGSAPSLGAASPGSAFLVSSSMKNLRKHTLTHAALLSLPSSGWDQ